MQFKDVNEILDFAVQKEEEAQKFYEDVAEKSSSKPMRKVFEDFAKEEAGHRKNLLKIKSGKLLILPQKKVLDLKIIEQTEDKVPSKDLDYRQALVIAMKREKESYKLYSELAELSEDDGVRGTFLILAQEEAKHKLRFEIEYDEHVFKEN